MNIGDLTAGLTGDLVPVRELAMRFVHEGTEMLAGSAALSHRPQTAPKAYAVRLYFPISEEQIKSYESIHDFNISRFYRPILERLNGMYAFGLNLFGVPPSMAKVPPLLDRLNPQPMDLATANQDWKKQFFVDKEFFYFGASDYSFEELIGYFFAEGGVIHAFRKNGESVGAWRSFRLFLDEELHRVELQYQLSEPREQVREKKPWYRKLW